MISHAMVLLIGLATCVSGGQNDLSGTFFRGDGIGESFAVEVTPGGRFAYTLDSDVGPIEHASGCVQVTGNEVRFVPDSAAELKDRSAILGTWFKVRWGQRLYLVRKDELTRFANHVNRGAEPRSLPTGRFALRRGDEEKPAKGLPELPEQWRVYLLPRPVRGTITALRSNGYAEVNLGLSSGLQSGMVLMAKTRAGGWSEVTVSTVEVDRSIVSVDLGEEPLFVGQTVTSRE